VVIVTIPLFSGNFLKGNFWRVGGGLDGSEIHGKGREILSKVHHTLNPLDNTVFFL
jgi:hypothetical protein